MSLLLILGACAAASAAQTPQENYYARKNTFGVFGAYSGNSSHILLGDAENRRLLQFGASYSRRLILNHVVNWQYNGELLPVVLESDPLGILTDNQTKPATATERENLGPIVSCAPFTAPYSFTDSVTGITYSGSTSVSCQGRRWVVGEAMSPVGLQWNFRPQRKLQPFLIGHGGYMYSSHEIPVDGAGSFNFTFDVGAGFELYRTRSKSVRAEFRYHHISNDNTAQLNPGIDNGMFQVTYCFGR
jgi:opacity protein-like surface antigen